MQKEIGKEYPPTDENFYIEQMVGELKNQTDELFLGDEKVLRQAETKMHGLLQAKFIINDELEDKYKVGVFAKPKTYDCMIRFSNAATGIKKDSVKDQRGMAIKLIGVEGEKIMKEERFASTQDFIGLNYETFVSKNIKEFSGIIKAFTGGKLKLLLFALNPMHWPLLFRIAKGKSKTPGSLLEQSYWSTTPFQYGSKNAMKFKIQTSLTSTTSVPKDPNPDFLREQMIDFLKQNGVSFDFLVQLQEDADSMPIEDPTIPWNSDFRKVATIEIPVQEFDTDERRNFGESLSFNPWHSLPEHRPLGGLNRGRLEIYSTLADYRNKKNGIQIFEPKDMSFKIPN